MSHSLSLARTTTERVLHATIFEIVANVLVFSILIVFASAAPTQSGVLTLVSSLIAMLWNYLFNLFLTAYRHALASEKGYWQGVFMQELSKQGYLWC